MIGKTISHYKILEKLGEGGMGVVYRAHDTKLNRDVALKFLPFNLHPSTEELKRFEQEAKAISSLNHANIATIHDVDEYNGQHYLVLEYIPGGTLKSKLKHLKSDDKDFTISEVVDYGLQMAKALAHAHQRGIIHRDVKTDNIMLMEDGTAKLTDFGLAKLRGSIQLTKTGSTVGTASYMSPEQVRGEEVDNRSDIFSFGIVLYELVTTHLPFRGEFETAINYSILNESPTLIRTLRKDTPITLENVIQRCLDKDKTKRYQSADEIVTELKKIQQTLAGGVLAVNKKMKAWWLASAGIIVALIGIYIFYPKSEPTSANSKTIAVLPFVNMSGSQDEYFADGIMEDILTQLSKIGELTVISRTTMMQYKGTKKTLKEISKELNAGVVLEGSVRRSGNRLRISSQLIEAEADKHLWADTYDRDMQDVFAVQSDVAQKITEALKVKLTPKDKTHIEKTPTENTEAYQLYLRGRFHWNKRTENGLLKAIEYFTQAIERDTNYALAYTGLADCYTLLPWYGNWFPKEGYQRGKFAAVKAIELDSTLAEAYISLGAIYNWYEWDWPSAERELRRGIELNPSNSTGHHWYGLFQISRGRFNEGIQELNLALKLDPFSMIINTNLGDAFYYARRFDEAINQYLKTIEIDSNFGYTHECLGRAYLEKGLNELALKELLKASTGRITKAYIALGKKTEAISYIKRLQERALLGPVRSIVFARAYLGIREDNQALSFLESASKEREPALTEELKVDPYYDPLRENTRFKELLTKIGFEK